MIALDQSAFGGRDRFEAEIGRMVDKIHSLPPADGENVYLPGEIEQRRKHQQLTDGVELAPSLLDELASLGAEHGVHLSAQR